MQDIQKDPLSSLFVKDARAVDRQQLADLVRPFISIDESSGEFGFLSSFASIDGNNQKIEIILCAAKARALYLNKPDGLLPSELIAMGVMAAGSVKSSLRILGSQHKINQDKDGRYLVPPYRIPELISQFKINLK